MKSPRANMVRVDMDFSATLFKTKISSAGQSEYYRLHTRLRFASSWQASAVAKWKPARANGLKSPPSCEIETDIYFHRQ